MANIQQAVILAAGRGSRMGALTAQQPKALTLLAGRPVLQWTIDALRVNGIQKTLTIGGWQAQQFDGMPFTKLNMQLRVNAHWAQGNMVRSMLCADDWLARAPTLLVYGDGAYGPSAVAQALVESEKEVALPIDTCWRTLWSRRFADPLKDAESLTREGPRLMSIGERAAHLDDIQGQFMGLLRLTPTGWQRIRKWLQGLPTVVVDKMDMTSMLRGLLASGVAVQCIEVRGGWVEIDSANDVQVVEQALHEADFLHDFRR